MKLKENMTGPIFAAKYAGKEMMFSKKHIETYNTFFDNFNNIKENFIIGKVIAYGNANNKKVLTYNIIYLIPSADFYKRLNTQPSSYLTINERSRDKCFQLVIDVNDFEQPVIGYDVQFLIPAVIVKEEVEQLIKALEL